MIFTANPGMGPDGLKAAFTRLIDELNRFHPTANRWPTFTDDAAAAAGNLKVGEPYATPDGMLRRRVS